MGLGPVRGAYLPAFSSQAKVSFSPQMSSSRALYGRDGCVLRFALLSAIQDVGI